MSVIANPKDGKVSAIRRISMSGIRYRRRGTAIVETNHGILLTAGRHGPFILPGGGAKRGESRFTAALRELTEESHLLPYAAEIIFKHRGKINHKHNFQDHHTVCIVEASGIPKPGGADAKRLSYYYPGCDVWVSDTTKEIIERYYEWKKTRFVSQVHTIMDEAEDGNIEDADGMSKDSYDSDE
jgi:8-oxo-dGTP diphosphatase